MKPNEIITSKFIEALGKGEIPWRKGWAFDFFFANATNPKRGYRGINVLLCAMFGKGETHFATIKQINGMGGRLNAGTKGFPIVFYSQIESKTEVDAKGQPKKFRLLRYSTVFPMSETTGCKWNRPESGKREFEPIEACEALIDGLAHDIVYDGADKAFYSLTDKKIHLPKRSAFFGNVEFYATLFHEIGHYLGDKAGDVQTGDKCNKEYAREELCAEIFSCFALNHFGLLADCAFDNSAAYVNHWISRLQSDPNLIIWAASRASKRLTTLLGEGSEVSIVSEESQPEGAELAGVS